MSDDNSIRRNSRFQDLTGKTFGRLTVLSYADKNKNGANQWKCVCACGATKTIVTSGLTSGRTNSCGCYKQDDLSERRTTHGKSKTREFRVWSAMLTRCSNPNQDNHAYYGDRGIVVCDGWKNSFESFLAEMGVAPSKKHEVDRINNEIGYVCGKCGQCCEKGWPLNCRWATRKENQRNKRSNHLVTCNGITKTLVEWSEETGINQVTLRYRLKRSWSDEQTILTPLRGTV